MLIKLPDIDEPFCVTERFCGDHKQNLSINHFEVLKHGHYKSFVLLTMEQQATLDEHRGGRKYDGYVNDNIRWNEWIDEHFDGSVVRANVTIATGTGRYNGNYLYGFSEPNDALMFKLKWI